jgi:hypothetical protein
MAEVTAQASSPRRRGPIAAVLRHSAGTVIMDSRFRGNDGNVASLFFWFAPDVTRKELTDFVGQKVG